MDKDKAVVKRAPNGVSPTSVAASVAPVLVLLGFNAQSSTLNIPLIVLTQLFTILLVQLLSIYTRVSSGSLRKAITLGPVKVELVQDKKPEPSSSITQVAGHPSTSALTATVPAQSALAPATTVTDDVTPAVQPKTLESTITESQVLKPGFPAARGIAIAEHTLYSNALIDGTLRRFLALVDAEQLKYLPGTSTDGADQVETVPLSTWPTMLTTPTSQVAKHPTIPHLYSVNYMSVAEYNVKSNSCFPPDSSDVP